MDDYEIQSFVQDLGGYWIRWHKNPPLLCHMGDIWERQIRSARVILLFLLKTHWQSLGDKSLNSRPLTFRHLTSFQPSFQLLTMNYKVVSPPAGRLLKPGVYSNIHWRRLQHIGKEIWSCWEKKIYSHCTNVKNGQAEEETLEKVILFC